MTVRRIRPSQWIISIQILEHTHIWNMIFRAKFIIKSSNSFCHSHRIVFQYWHVLCTVDTIICWLYKTMPANTFPSSYSVFTHTLVCIHQRNLGKFCGASPDKIERFDTVMIANYETSRAKSWLYENSKIACIEWKITEIINSRWMGNLFGFAS